MGDALQRVVVGRRQMIGHARVLARQHHIPRRLRPGADPARLAVRSGALLMEAQRVPGAAQSVPRPVQRQAPGERPSLVQQPRFLVRRVRAGPRRVGGPVGRLADVRHDLAAGAETAIQQAACVQVVDDGGIVAKVIGLAPHRRLPIQPQPGQILENRGLIFGPTAGLVDVLDAQDEAPACGARRRPGGQGREGVAPVQQAGGRRGEAGDEHQLRRAAGRRLSRPPRRPLGGPLPRRSRTGRSCPPARTWAGSWPSRSPGAPVR
jgi:hypothetical protein